jgi:hypothetical protein
LLVGLHYSEIQLGIIGVSTRPERPGELQGMPCRAGVVFRGDIVNPGYATVLADLQ